ncbi:MAG: hypothetical protein MUC69_11650, partial [Gemmatimonadales bacterium]|nr:hypothetical protein [Gemmatimonadales bacterium]
MRQPLGPTDFFAIEAGDCLDRLERVLGRPEGVAGEEFVREARVLRGAALMANLESVAQAAAAFEALARAVRGGTQPWDAATRELAQGVMADFRALVRRVHDWSDGDAARARRIAGDLALATGGRGTGAGRVRTPVPSDPRAGVRAYVAREAALIAEALERAAAHDGATAGDDAGPLREVLHRMQPLRGLADLAEFSPLPELLDAIDLAVTAAQRSGVAPAHAREVLDAAGRSLGHLAREGVEAGEPALLREVRQVAALLLARLGDESDVVAVETLFAAGDPAPVVAIGGLHEGGRPALGTVELVSHSDYLTQMADRLERAAHDAARLLGLATLLASCRGLRSAAAGHPGVQGFANAAVRRIASGEAAEAPAPFVAWLRRAAQVLRAAGESPDADASAAWR